MKQVIDFHTHIFPDQIAARTIDMLQKKGGIQAFSDATRQGLLRSMNEADIALSVILPVVTKPEQFATINKVAAEINEYYFAGEGRTEQKKLLSFGGIHPDNEDYKARLQEIAALGLQGIKLHPDYQQTYFDDIRYMRIIDYATELGLIISVHTGVDVAYPDDIHATPKRIKQVLREVKPEKLVLAHYGSLFLWDEVEELLVGEPVYFDTAVIDGKIQEEQFLRILKHHGSERILFATDNPWSGQKQFLDWFDKLALTETERENILHLNAERLLQIEK